VTGLGIGLAVLIGVSLGLLGGGGSILTVPVFVYVLGYDPKRAIAMSLAVVGTTSLLGAVTHWRAGHVRLRVAAVFGGIAMIGSYAGARLSALVSGTAQLTGFAIVMLVAAVFMLRSAIRPEEPRPAAAVSTPLLGMLALGVGLLTGLVGIGGGFLIVPALALGAGLPMRHAIGTSLAVIAFNAFTGFAGYAGQFAIPWGIIAVFSVAAIAGVFVGSAGARFVAPGTLRKGFAVFLVVMGLFMLYQNRGAFTRPTHALIGGARSYDRPSDNSEVSSCC